MTILLIVLGVLAYLPTVRMATGHFAWWMYEHWFRTQKKPGGPDWTVSFLAACVWPAVLALWVAYRAGVLVCRVSPPIGAEKRHYVREERASLQRAHDARAKRLGLPRS